MYICVEGYKYSVICVRVILENWDRACLLAQYPSYQPHPSVDPSEGTVQCLHAHRGIGDNQTAMIDIIIPLSDRRFCTCLQKWLQHFFFFFFNGTHSREKQQRSG